MAENTVRKKLGDMPPSAGIYRDLFRVKHSRRFAATATAAAAIVLGPSMGLAAADDDERIPGEAYCAVHKEGARSNVDDDKVEVTEPRHCDTNVSSGKGVVLIESDKLRQPVGTMIPHEHIVGGIDGLVPASDPKAREQRNLLSKGDATGPRRIERDGLGATAQSNPSGS